LHLIEEILVIFMNYGFTNLNPKTFSLDYDNYDFSPSVKP